MEPTFGERLCRWLAVKGMRPGTLARKMGLSRPTLQAWIRDDASPQGKRLPAIAEALGITQAELFGPLPDLPESGDETGGAAA